MQEHLRFLSAHFYGQVDVEADSQNPHLQKQLSSAQENIWESILSFLEALHKLESQHKEIHLNNILKL